MIKSCDNCGKEFLTEADLFVYQDRPQGEYYSCGCVEFKDSFSEKKRKAISEQHTKAIGIMLKAEGVPYPAKVVFLAQAAVALAQAQRIMGEKEDEN